MPTTTLPTQANRAAHRMTFAFTRSPAGCRGLGRRGREPRRRLSRAIGGSVRFPLQIVQERSVESDGHGITRQARTDRPLGRARRRRRRRGRERSHLSRLPEAGAAHEHRAHAHQLAARLAPHATRSRRRHLRLRMALSSVLDPASTALHTVDLTQSRGALRRCRGFAASGLRSPRGAATRAQALLAPRLRGSGRLWDHASR